MSECFNLERVASLVLLHGFKRVVLQFPDEHLEHCVTVYARLLELLGTASNSSDSGGGGGVGLYIAADSTFGSSVDDVSAQHVDSDVLIYFGNDLSSSGAMPVMIVPAAIDVDVEDCIAKFSARVEGEEREGSSKYADIILLYEPGCQAHIAQIADRLRTSRPTSTIHVASLPPCADLDHWGSQSVTAEDEPGSATTTTPTCARIGGLLVPESIVHSSTASSTSIFYIGDKETQRDGILLHLSQHTMTSYSPRTKTSSHILGAETRVFRQRYLGVQAVASARIVGLIIGSMGLTGESTRGILERLHQLLDAGGKKYYTFVMGRLNEAKICNFPEIDIFCFISNEDVSVIAPKTFDKPVITPWELELGLGAREWECSYRLNPDAIVSNCTQAEFETVLQRVRAARPEGNGIDDIEDADADADADADSIEKQQPSEVEDRLIQHGTRALAIFHSASGELLQQRTYQGLVPDVPAEQTTAIQRGLYGIAAGYERNSKCALTESFRCSL